MNIGLPMRPFIQPIFKDEAKKWIRATIPLFLRKRMAVWLQRQDWIPPHRSIWWSTELIRDFIDLDINEYHNFLWSHHLGYAMTYEAGQRFGAENIKPSRRLFFSDLKEHLVRLNPIARIRIDSILEVGCSLGYQLRFLETDMFPAATALEGIDIDGHAIQSGLEYLQTVGSKIRLNRANIQTLESFLGDRHVDLSICTGVLMYLKEEDAAAVVAAMLKHSRVMVAMAGLAHPEVDNRNLPHSAIRDRDHTFIHNIDAMVKNAGGRVIARRWEGDHTIDGHTIYFVFAVRD